MASIVIDDITGQQPAHKAGEANFRAAQKNMGVVAHQDPGIDAGFCSGSKHRLKNIQYSNISELNNIKKLLFSIDKEIIGCPLNFSINYSLSFYVIIEQSEEQKRVRYIGDCHQSR